MFSIKAKNKSDFDISYGDATSSLLVTGSTGSGKTSSVMYPVLDNLCENKCPGIILDVKGDYINFMEGLRDKGQSNIVFIGGSERCKGFNIMQGMNRHSFISLIESISTKQKGAGNYWGSKAVNSSLLIYDYLNSAQGRNPTLAELAHYLIEPASLVEDLSGFILGAKTISKDLESSIKKGVSDEFSIIRMGVSSHPFPEIAAPIFNMRKGQEASRLSEQFTWHHDSLINALGEFIDNPILKEKLSSTSEGSLDMADMIYEKNSVLVVDMPITVYSRAGHALCNLLRSQFYSAIFSYDATRRVEKGFGKDKFSFMLIDEYQTYANFESDHGIYNDNTFVDKSRSFGQINIFSTQGISSLLSTCGKGHSVDSFIQNVRNKIFLSTDDSETINKVKMLSEDGCSSEIVRPDKIGTCFVYLGKNSKVGGGAAYGLGMLGIKNSKYLNSNFGGVNESMYLFDDTPVENPYKIKSSENISRIVVLTHRYGMVKDDFISGILDGCRMLARDPKEILESIDFFYFPKKPTSEQMTSTFKSILDKCGKSDTLCFIRGGGSDEDFCFYNDKETYRTIERTKAKGKIRDFIASIGHHDNQTAVDKISSIKASTPTQLGYMIVQCFDDDSSDKYINDSKSGSKGVRKKKSVKVDADSSSTKNKVNGKRVAVGEPVEAIGSGSKGKKAREGEIKKHIEWIKSRIEDQEED